jgi:hypothetical protein
MHADSRKRHKPTIVVTSRHRWRRLPAADLAKLIEAKRQRAALHHLSHGERAEMQRVREHLLRLQRGGTS